MTIDDNIIDEENNTTLIEKQQKYQNYHQAKFIKKNILQVKKFCHLIKVE